MLYMNPTTTTPATTTNDVVRRGHATITFHTYVPTIPTRSDRKADRAALRLNLLSLLLLPFGGKR